MNTPAGGAKAPAPGVATVAVLRAHTALEGIFENRALQRAAAETAGAIEEEKAKAEAAARP